jgi:hypothetical protein
MATKKQPTKQAGPGRGGADSRSAGERAMDAQLQRAAAAAARRREAEARSRQGKGA